MGSVSPPPGVAQTGTKAVIGGVLGFLGAFLTTLLTVWTDRDPLVARDVVFALSGGVAFAAVTYFGVYNLPNKPR
jgi:hypothetical protein